MIAQNLEWAKSRIERALRKAGRQPGDVRLVAVSKTINEAKILEAIDAGILEFGENKIQEARSKILNLNRFNLCWHMIGHLQRNKVKYIYDLFNQIHSVDSLELAEEIHQGAKKRGKVMPVLIQVNIAQDSSKFGVGPDQLEGILEKLSNYNGIQVEGLMTMAPYDPDPEKSRSYYARLRELADRMDSLDMDRIFMKELSMGMTSDFLVAVEEGATMVRLGTSIFGERP